MLVTAIALFFSTFSTPMLSAALTFGLYVVGHFNADLRNFDQVVSSSRPPGWRAALYYVLPDLSAFDVKTAGRARPAGDGRLHAVDDRRTGWPTSRRCCWLSTFIFSRRDFK